MEEVVEVTSREDHDARKAEKAKAQALAAKNARKLMDSAATDAAKATAKVADKYYAIGSLMVASTLPDRAFAIVAEHGSREAFEALGIAQPRRLSSYRRARVIFAACDAAGADIGEAVELFMVETRERGEDGDLGIKAFAEYCARGFAFPVEPTKKKEPTVTLGALFGKEEWTIDDARQVAALIAEKVDGDADKLDKLAGTLTDAADKLRKSKKSKRAA